YWHRTYFARTCPRRKWYCCQGASVACLEVKKIQQEVESLIGVGKQPMQTIHYTPRAKKVVELSQDEARKLGHSYVGTEHILLGLIREGEGVAARVLNNL